MSGRRVPIPEPLKPHRVDLYPLLGTSPAGKTFGDKLERLHVLVEDKMRNVRTSSGDVVQSSRAVYLDQLEVTLGSEVDYLGDRREIVAISQGRIGTRLAHSVLYLA
jgi:hypothetical protein